jgi:hypothetical protein
MPWKECSVMDGNAELATDVRHRFAVQQSRHKPQALTGLTGPPQAGVWGELSHGEHYASSLVSSAVDSPSATHSFFASMISSAGSSLWRRRALSHCSCWICRAEASGFGPRLFGAGTAGRIAPRLRHGRSAI